ncbi:MAG: TIGR03086 family metal-binding protein, partial [Dermatophilaceae bacterium]
LVHEGLNEQQEAMHAQGWHHYLDRLGRLAATGDAGPDALARVPESLTPVTAADAVLAAIQPVLRRLTAEDRPKPTPCAEFSCHDVIEHLFVSLVRLGAMARAQVRNPAEGSLENRISVMAAQAIDAWRSVDLAGMVPGPGGKEMPASFAAGILPLELVLHGWDLAQGSGQQIEISDELVDYLRGLAEMVVPAARPGGSFADEVSPAEDASALDRLAAFAGRTPLAA